MSLLLYTAAASAKLHLWHLQKKCHLKAARTPSTCLKRWKTTEQQLAMVRYHGNVFDLVQETMLLVHFEAPLTVTLSQIAHDYILFPLIKHNSCLFYSHGWLKMVECMEEQPLPLTRQRAATGMTRCTGTWETQLTLLPWQPSQRITVLQHITPPTTLAASEICCSSLLCMAVVRCFGSHSGFLITHCGD